MLMVDTTFSTSLLAPRSGTTNSNSLPWNSQRCWAKTAQETVVPKVRYALSRLNSFVDDMNWPISSKLFAQCRTRRSLNHFNENLRSFDMAWRVREACDVARDQRCNATSVFGLVIGCDQL